MVVKKTQSARVKEIAIRLGVPEVTVKRIIDEYIESLQKSVMNGEDVEIRGVFSIKAEDIDGKVIPRGNVSVALKEKIKRGYI